MCPNRPLERKSALRDSMLFLFSYTGGVCSVEAEDRNDCGWIGIDEATCEYRGCCYDETVPDVAWCFYPTGL